MLGEAGLLDASLRGALVRMARFRNALLHEDTAVNAEIVVGILNDRVEDLAGFSGCRAEVALTPCPGALARRPA